MKKAHLLAVLTFVLLAAAVAVGVSCAGVKPQEQQREEKVLVRVTEPCPFTIVDDGHTAEVVLTQPVIPRVWYPGDGPVDEDSITYYAVRCWPGCHDPNSTPRPQHY
jgi:hypothetical protein